MSFFNKGLLNLFQHRQADQGDSEAKAEEQQNNQTEQIQNFQASPVTEKIKSVLQNSTAQPMAATGNSDQSPFSSIESELKTLGSQFITSPDFVNKPVISPKSVLTSEIANAEAIDRSVNYVNNFNQNILNQFDKTKITRKKQIKDFIPTFKPGISVHSVSQLLPTLPPGTRRFDDPVSIRQAIYDRVLQEISSYPTVENSKYRLELTDVRYEDPEEYSAEEYKKRVLTNSSLFRRIRGTFKLYSKDGNLVEEKRVTLAQVPYLTNHGTFIINGNKYTLANQMRLEPGIYHRVKANGELEAHVNVLPGRGLSHRYLIEPSTGVFKLVVSQAQIPLIAVLKLLGATDDEIREAWGDELFQINYSKLNDHVIDRLYNKFAYSPNPKLTSEEKKREILRVLQNTELNPFVTKITLGKPIDRLTKEAILLSTKKLLQISRGLAKPDDRDNLAFQTFLGPEDLLAERVRKARGLINQILWKATFKNNLSVINPGFLTKYINAAIFDSGLGQPLDEINPAEILEQLTRVSRLGYGGIPSVESIPDESRNVQPSYLNFIDLFRAPECYSQDTQVLTMSGWKDWPDVTENDYLACLIDGQVKWHKPLRLISYDYDGEMIDFSDGIIAFTVTANHRMYVKLDPQEPFKFIEAARLPNDSKLFFNVKLNFNPTELTNFIDLNIAKNSKFSDVSINFIERQKLFTKKLFSSQFNYELDRVQVKAATSDEAELLVFLGLGFGLPGYSREDNAFFIYNNLVSVNFGIKTIDYSGKVYCAEVPGGLLYVKKRGYMGFWCGNSVRIGVDNRLAFSAIKGSDGKIYSLFYDAKTNTPRWLNPQDIYDKVVAFPNEINKPEPYVFAKIGDQVKLVPKEQVDYYIPSFDHTFNHLANLIAIKNTNYGHRISMGSRYTIQALPLKEPEAPFVRAGVPGHPDKSFEELYGGFVGVIKAKPNVSGVVEKVTPTEIIIKYDDGSVIKHEYHTNFPYNRKCVAWNTLITIRRKSGLIWNGPICQYNHKPGDSVLSVDKDSLVISWKPVRALAVLNNDRRLFKVTLRSGAFVVTTEDHAWVVPDSSFTKLNPVDAKGLSVGDKVPITSFSTVKKSSQLFIGEMPALIFDEVVSITELPKSYSEKVYDLDVNNSTFLCNGCVFIHNTYLHNIVTVQPGQRVQPGQVLAKSNYSDDTGAIALGKNLRIAYLPFLGFNYEDAYVVSESAANKLSSEHLYQFGLDFSDDVKTKKLDYISLFPAVYTRKQLENIDENGVVKVGSIVNYGDPLILNAKKRAITHKSAYSPHAGAYADETIVWDKPTPGYVTDAVITPNGAVVAVKTTVPLKIGDKISGRYGDKGVVSKIIPDDEMPVDSEGRPFEILANPSIIISRCYDKNTEFITESGIKKYDKILPNELLLAYSPEYDRLIWAKQLDHIYVNKYIGPLYKYEDENVSLCVTPNHNFIICRDDGSLAFETAENLIRKKVRIPASRSCLFNYYQDVKNLDFYYEQGRNLASSPEKVNVQVLSFLWLSTQPENALKAILDGFFSTWNNGNDLSDVAIDRLQFIAALVGEILIVSVEDGGVFLSRRAKADYFELRPENWSVIEYTGPVSCPAVYTGCLIVRHNGKLSICGNTNPAQLFETALGKIVAKTGKPYRLIDADQNVPNRAAWVEEELRKHGLSSKETVLDPVTNTTIPDITTGVRYFMKLHHTSESKGKGRGLGGYTADETPARGGEEGSKRVALMDVHALLSHGATEVLRDSKLIKGQKNQEFWAQFMSGNKPPVNKVPLVFEKFVNFLKGSGINVIRNGSKFNILALTKSEIDTLAGDRELKNSETVRWDQGMRPVPGGLFDPTLTGGHTGNRWSFIKLAEPMPNPVMEEPIRRLLNLTSKDFEAILSGKKSLNGLTGPKAIYSGLDNLNVDLELNKALEGVKSAKRGLRNDFIKKLRYLHTCKKYGMHPREWMWDKVPVIPPIFRPVSKLQDSDIRLIADVNYLYKDVFDINNELRELKNKLTDVGDERLALYKSMKALAGLGDPVSTKNSERNLRGLLAQVFGENPKFGSFQQKLIGSNVDLVGRAVVIPNPDLTLDEIGLPEARAWEVYTPFVIRNLIKQGVSKLQALQYAKDRHPLARKALLEEMQDRPVIVNRAPVLHRFGVMAFIPRLTKGDVLQVSPLVIQGFNMDFDGDASNYYVPVSDEAKEEALVKLLPSRNLYNVASFDVHYEPIREYLGGLYTATSSVDDKKKPITFATAQEALRAFQAGQISLDQPVEILNQV